MVKTTTSFSAPLLQVIGRKRASQPEHALFSRFLLGASWLTVALLLSLAGCGRSQPHSPLPGTKAKQPEGRVLMVLSAAGNQKLANGKVRDTGYFLGEFFAPYEKLRALGYEIEIATVAGEPPVVDPESLKKGYFESPDQQQRAMMWLEQEAPGISPISLATAREQVSQYQGVIVPGGQGVMVDLLRDPTLHDVIFAMAEQDKAIGLICHAPAILLHLPEGHSLQGRKVTAVSPFEEFYIEQVIMGSRALDRKIGRSLRRAGYDYGSRHPKANHAVRDCNLVTSQNPYSGSAFDEHYVAALWAVRNGETCE